MRRDGGWNDEGEEAGAMRGGKEGGEGGVMDEGDVVAVVEPMGPVWPEIHSSIMWVGTSCTCAACSTHSLPPALPSSLPPCPHSSLLPFLLPFLPHC